MFGVYQIDVRLKRDDLNIWIVKTHRAITIQHYKPDITACFEPPPPDR